MLFQFWAAKIRLFLAISKKKIEKSTLFNQIFGYVGEYGYLYGWIENCFQIKIENQASLPAKCRLAFSVFYKTRGHLLMTTRTDEVFCDFRAASLASSNWLPQCEKSCNWWQRFNCTTCSGMKCTGHNGFKCTRHSSFECATRNGNKCATFSSHLKIVFQESWLSLWRETTKGISRIILASRTTLPTIAFR